MKRIGRICMAFLGAILLAAVAALAQQGKWAAAGDPTAESMIDMERQWAEMPCLSHDILGKMLADDFQGTSPEGKRYSKTDELKSDVGSKIQARDCRLNDARVRFFGESAALIYGSESSIRKGTDGKEFKRCLVWTDTWLKRNGAWQVVSAQDTQIPCK
jgi:hypothetical protein